MECPACSAQLVQVRVERVELHQCEACRGTLVARADIRALGAQDPARHAVLRPGSDEPAPRARVGGTKVLGCPRCGGPMLSFAFGGGRTHAESCQKCEAVFFDRGELGRVLEEQRSGIALTEDDRRLLHGHKLMFTWDRLNRAHAAIALAVITGAFTFVTLVRRPRWGLASAAGLAFLSFLVLWMRAERRRVSAERHAKDLIEREQRRTEEKPLGEAPAGPWAPAPKAGESASGGTPASGSSRSSSARRGRPCPFCAAPLPAGTTHCDACDSDFG